MAGLLAALCAWLMASALACAPGSFRSADSSCQPCAPQTFMPNANASACWSCPPNAFAAPDRTRCICHVGSTWNASTRACDACAPGSFFVIAPDGGRSCQPCRADTYQPNAAQPHCLSCPPSTYAAEGSASCTECARDGASATSAWCAGCPPGSEYDAYERSCMPCRLDFYKPKHGFEPCIPCAPNAFADAGSAECIQCGAHSAPMRDGACGSCAAGQRYDAYDRDCKDCERGTFTSHANALEQCLVCAGHSYAFEGAAACVRCGAGQALMRNGSCAACAAGFFYDDAHFGCERCAANHVSGGGAAATCRTCPRGSYSRPGASQCSYCAPNTGYVASLDRCAPCAPGHFYDQYGASCVPCHTASVKPDAGIDFCHICAPGFTSNGNRTACVPY